MNSSTRGSIVYVTRDIERALAYEAEGYFIISNSNNYAKSMTEGRADILLIEEDGLLDTWQLLQHPKTIDFINNISEPNILVFKNTPTIERICEEHAWNLLNPPAEISAYIEEKISQVEWLGDLSHYLPVHTIDELQNIHWQNEPLVVQFNRAHTGSGTLYIDKDVQLKDLQKKFPKRPVRVTQYVEGDPYTINVAVDKDGFALAGSWSYQITGLSPFTTERFATVGNDWKFAATRLKKNTLEKMNVLVHDAAKRMHNTHWRGLFGIDVIVDASGNVFLIEINARQPASTSYESFLQKNHTLFEAHLAALSGESLKDFGTTHISSGAQIVLRNQAGVSIEYKAIAPRLEELGLRVIAYERSTKPGSDAMRIQTTDRLLDDADKPNKILKQITEIINEHTGTSDVDSVPMNKDSYTDTAAHLESATVSPQTKKLIHAYTDMQFGAQTVQCPYFNNKRTRLRAALPALIGKGLPEEIVEEAKLLALQQKIDLSKLDAEHLKKFLVDSNLGVDCSGYAYHLLDQELRARGFGSLKKYLQFEGGGLFRRIIRTFRTIENANVKVFAHEKNSTEIELCNIKPADLIVIIDSGNDFARDHVLFVTDVEYKNEKVEKIIYTHTFQWSTDGKYNHGVRNGEIVIVDSGAKLTEQKWIEQGAQGKENETLQRALRAKRVEIRRLRT